MCSITFDWESNDAMDKVRRFERTRGKSHGDLLWATVEFTEACNHACIYCYENAGPLSRPRSMGRPSMKSLIGYLADGGVRQLTCSGGEPLMYPHVREAVKLARDRGMVVHMITNGYFLSREAARSLSRAGLTQVQINIDSVDPAKHDRMRGRRGSFSRAVRALRNAREAGMTCVTQTVLTRLNEDEVMDIFRLARGMGVQRCRVWDITPSEGRARGNMHLMPERNYMETVRRIAAFAAETGAVNIESGDPLFHGRVFRDLPVTGGYCPYAIGILANLSVAGDSYFCCANREEPMYNVFRMMDEGRDLTESHASALREFLGRMQLKGVDEKCRACGFFDTCKGGCYVRRKFAGFRRDYWCTL
jgi:radical SAM protein with 4Fe4S-binding SPASM domain